MSPTSAPSGHGGGGGTASRGGGPANGERAPAIDDHGAVAGQLAHDLEIADREQALADHGRRPHTALACLGPGLDLGGHGQHRRAATGGRDAEPTRSDALGHGLPLHEDRVGDIECAGNQRHGSIGLDSADQDVAGASRFPSPWPSGRFHARRGRRGRGCRSPRRAACRCPGPGRRPRRRRRCATARRPPGRAALRPAAPARGPPAASSGRAAGSRSSAPAARPRWTHGRRPHRRPRLAAAPRRRSAAPRCRPGRPAR